MGRQRTAVIMGHSQQAEFGLSMLSQNYNVVGAVPVLPEPEWTGHSFVRQCPVPLYRSHRDVPVVDLVLSVFYDQIIDADTIDRQGTMINLHNSLLPKHRGCNPVNWALKNGDREHGVTLHVINEGIDTGPILGQRRFAIDPEVDEVYDVYERCLIAGRALLRYHVGGSVTKQIATSQHGESSYHGSKDHERLGERKGWRRP